MLEDVRRVTLDGIEHLTNSQLFEPPLSGEYPIGAYLMHLAECDISWLEILSGMVQPEELKAECYYDSWYDPSKTSSPPKSSLEKKAYLSILEKTRKNFLDYVSTINDDAFEEEVVFKGKTSERRFKKKWIVYHILEHEAHHRGQMFLLIRKAGWIQKK